MSTPTADKEQALATFKKTLIENKKFDEKRHDDHTLSRFLRARRYDQEKSMKMLMDYEQWRVEYKVDEVVDTFSFPSAKEVNKIYPRFYHKTDKLGRPIYIERFNNFDLNAIFKFTDQENFLKNHVRSYEKLMQYRFPACSIKAGHHVDQGCSILDLKGVPISQFNQVRKVLNSLSKIASDYYPETMGRLFVVNAPMLFTAVWAVVKGWLDENTVAKISILGSNFLPTLLEVIDIDSLPDFLGGNCKAPPEGWENADVGPWNDGSVSGYPQPKWEGFTKRDEEAASKQ